jgi:hypothetical protein
MVVGGGGGAHLQGVPQPAVPQQGAFDMGILGLALKKLTEDNAILLQAKREADIQGKVSAHTNPMSKRSVEQDLRLLNCLDDLQGFCAAMEVNPDLTLCKFGSFQTFATGKNFEAAKFSSYSDSSFSFFQSTVCFYLPV